MQAEEREAGRTSALDPAAPVPFRVVSRMTFAFRLHPLGDLEFVSELEHDLLLLEKSGSRIADSRCGLGCNLLFSCRLLRCALLSGLHRCGCPRFLAGCLLGWSKRAVDFG